MQQYNETVRFSKTMIYDIADVVAQKRPPGLSGPKLANIFKILDIDTYVVTTTKELEYKILY